MVIGHERQLKLLERHVMKGDLSHAYLFSGPEHLGKRTIAETCIRALVCEKARGLEVCGECAGCVALAHSVHPDVMILDAGDETIGIEEIRTIKDRASRTALRGGRKCFLLTDVGKLTREAANSFLKLLEEPAGESIFFLVAHDAVRVLPTIHSRVWHMKFWPVSDTLLTSYLEKLMPHSKRLSRILLLAAGRPGAALSIGEESDAAFTNRLEEINNSTALVTRGDIRAWIKVIERHAKDAESARAMTTRLEGALRVAFEETLLAGEDSHNPLIYNKAHMLGLKLKILLDAKTLLDAPAVNSRLVFESLVLGML